MVQNKTGIVVGSFKTKGEAEAHLYKWIMNEQKDR